MIILQLYTNKLDDLGLNKFSRNQTESEKKKSEQTYYQ